MRTLVLASAILESSLYLINPRTGPTNKPVNTNPRMPQAKQLAG